MKSFDRRGLRLIEYCTVQYIHKLCFLEAAISKNYYTQNKPSFSMT
jgi:hypothetical protein